MAQARRVLEGEDILHLADLDLRVRAALHFDPGLLDIGAHGMEIRAGHIYLAPGDFHFQVAREGTTHVARLSQTAPENFCRPSVDPLFRSVAQVFGAEGCAVMLTGMGSDGSSGARVMAAGGAPIIAQDEATSVVWGMPGAVAQAGICSAILPLPQIAGHLTALFERGAA